MRVTLVTHHYPPNRVGGVELITEKYARWLRKAGHQVEIVCIEEIQAESSLRVETESREGITVHRLSVDLASVLLPVRWYFKNDVVGRWFEGYLTDSGPDLVHIQSCYLLSASVVEVACRAGLATVLSLHDYWFVCPRVVLRHPNGERCSGSVGVAECVWCLNTERRRYRLPDQVTGGWLGNVAAKVIDSPGIPSPLGWGRMAAAIRERRQYLAQVLRMPEVIVTQARLVQDMLLQDGFEQSRVRLVPYGLDLGGWQHLSPIPSQAGLRFGYLGQIRPFKGVHVLIEAFNRVHARGSVPSLRVYGDWDGSPRYAKKLCRLARGNPAVLFMGRYDNRQIEDILREIDVLVVPSMWYETGPLVTMEAFAAGVPVVATDIPNMKYQVERNVNGLLFEPDDVEDLTAQLQTLVDNPALVDRLRQGIPAVRTVDDEMQDLVQVYEMAQEREASSRSLSAN
jgi:glycosyltransferase involved in cell wall biosynthesis